MPTLSYCKSTNNCSLNLLLLKFVYLYQDYNSTENQGSLIYGMTNMTNQNRKNALNDKNLPTFSKAYKMSRQ